MDTETGGLTERASELQSQTRPERPGILAECQPTTRIRLTVYLSLFKDPSRDGVCKLLERRGEDGC